MSGDDFGLVRRRSVKDGTEVVGRELTGRAQEGAALPRRMTQTPPLGLFARADGGGKKERLAIGMGRGLAGDLWSNEGMVTSEGGRRGGGGSGVGALSDMLRSLVGGSNVGFEGGV